MEGRCLKMATEDQKLIVQCRGRRFLIFSSTFTVLLAAAIMIYGFILFFMLQGEVPGKSAAFENAATILQMAVPVFIANSVLTFLMMTSRLPEHVSEKIALLVIKDEIDAVKNMVADISLMVATTSPTKGEASEELVCQLKLLSSHLDEMAAFALKTKEQAEFVIQKTESYKKVQKESRNTCECCSGNCNKATSGEASQISITAAYNSTNRKVDLAEVSKEKVTTRPGIIHLEMSDIREKSRQGLHSLTDALVRLLDSRRETSAKTTTPESCGASRENETGSSVEVTEKEQLHLAEAKIEVSGLEKATSEAAFSKRTEEAKDETCCSEKAN